MAQRSCCLALLSLAWRYTVRPRGDFRVACLSKEVEAAAPLGLCVALRPLLLRRVQVLAAGQEHAWALDSVLVKFIDEGRTGLVARGQLLHLPERVHSLPPQAVEFIVCRVKPVDNETEWNPKVGDLGFLYLLTSRIYLTQSKHGVEVYLNLEYWVWVKCFIFLGRDALPSTVL